MLLGLKGLCYKERLNGLGLVFLECKMLGSDLMKVFKVMRGIDKVNIYCLFPGWSSLELEDIG